MPLNTTELDEDVEYYRTRRLAGSGPFGSHIWPAGALVLKVREGGRVVPAYVLFAGAEGRRYLGLDARAAPAPPRGLRPTRRAPTAPNWSPA